MTKKLKDRLARLGLERKKAAGFVTQCTTEEVMSLLKKFHPEISKISAGGIKIPRGIKFNLQKGAFETDKGGIKELFKMTYEKKDERLRNGVHIACHITQGAKMVILAQLHLLLSFLDPLKVEGNAPPLLLHLFF